jgi:uncharacterized protein (TIGR03382 family)
MVRSLLGVVTLSIFWISGASALHAGVIRGAVGVTATVAGFPSGGQAALINQSGLSTPYVSGVTDFATYVGSTTHASQSFSPANIWSGGANNQYSMSIDMGALFPITGLAVWNLISSQAAVTSIRLYTDTDGNLNNGFGPEVGTFNINVHNSVATNLATVLSFSEVSTQYFVIEPLTSVIGIGSGFALAEIAFNEVVPVPEPGTAVLGFAGLGLLALLRRRR